ncbi:hypothetical protein Tco_0970815 [Tanacetum coccineum]
MKMEILLEPTSKQAHVMRTASAAVKPCQGDSSELYLIKGSIYTDQQGTMVIATIFDEVQKSQVHKMAKLQDGKTRLCLVDDLKALKITSSLTKQDKGTSSCLKSKDTTTYSQDEANERYKVYELRTKDKA